MKNLVFILCLFPAFLFGQETIDTLSHITGECESYDNEEFNFILSNDTLKFFGKITAHCGNCDHFLIYSRLSDTIYLTKLDTGELDDCLCRYNFNISIPECDKNKHRLLLLNYLGNDTIVDTLISRKPTFIQNQKKNDMIIYPNPSTGLINIKLPKNESNINVKIYDNDGKCLLRKFYPNTENVIINEPFSSGVYFIKINFENVTYSNKLIIN